MKKPERACHPFLRSSRLLLALAALVVFALVAAPMPKAHAGTPIVVNSSAATKVTDGLCTLREAIENANNNAATWPDCGAGAVGADTIELPTGATITLTDADNGINEEVNGLPFIASDITINGNNAIIERSSAPSTPNFRIFKVNSGTLTLNNVTVRNGKTSVHSTLGYSGYGGGFEVSNAATLVLNDCTVSGNSTGDVTGAISGFGGGINGESGATVTINNSTISGNRTGSVVSGTDGVGGGISTNGAHLTVTNSTISGNSTGEGNQGGGIRFTVGTTTGLITNSTITGNIAGTGGGIFINGSAAALTLRNTIVALNTATYSGSNCSAAVTNGGNNLDSGTSCGWGSTNGSLSNVADPRLGPLADNGGPTWTHRLLSGSPAIDGVTYNAPNGSPSTDQRGIARPKGARYDIGAFENDLVLLFLPMLAKH